MNRLKESNIFSGGGVIPLNNRRTLLKSYIWNYVVSNSGKVTLENSIKGDIDLELNGDTEQLTTTGKNIFDPKQLQGISGFTIEGNEITQSRYNASTGKTLKQLCPEIIPGTYFLSTSNSEFSGLFGLTKPFYKNNAIEITEEDLNRIVSLVGAPNKTIKFTLQLERGDKATPYEPHTGGKPSPSPEYPQEVKSAGRKSRNLLIENISVFTVQDNIAYIPLPEGHETKLYTMLIQKKPGENDDVGFTCGFYDESNMTATYSAPCLQAGNLVTGNGIINSKIGVNHFVCFSPADSRFFDIYNVMYAEGKETTLDYEPYGYLLDVKMTGKNLFDCEKARDTTNWIIRDGDGYAKFPIRVGKGNKATFSYTEKLTVGKGFYLGIAQSDTGSAVGWLYHSTEINLNNNKLTVVAKGDCLYLSCNKSSIQKFFDTIQTLQVEIGSEQTVYEPYTEQTLTLTPDRPLTKWDKLTEQGGQYGWLYKHRNITFNGGETWKIHSNNMSFYTEIADTKFQNSFCDKYRHKLSAWAEQEYGIYSDNNYVQKYFRPPHEGFEMNVDIWKAFLNKNPLTVICESMNTEFVPLPQSEQTQLRNLHSYNGTTHITVDSGEVPCGIKVAYKQKK